MAQAKARVKLKEWLFGAVFYGRGETGAEPLTYFVGRRQCKENFLKMTLGMAFLSKFFPRSNGN